ncbi:MAG: FkbM family methyltransferase [Sphingobacteriaceae bacterium]
MSWFSRIAYKIRHSVLLEKSEGLWNVLRKPYHFILDIRGTGVKMNVNGLVDIKIPALFYSEHLAAYEEENINCLISWIKKNPDSYILDLGCSTGYISTVALFTSETCKVIGFDSDISSLKASQRMSQYSKGKRLSLVYGLITDVSTIDKTIEEAVVETEIILKNSIDTGDPGTTHYINLDKNLDGKIPQYSIDLLFKDFLISSPILIKCDIEGAELFALNGSKEFLRMHHPAILLSVHEFILPVFNCDKKQVSEFLKTEGYRIEVISIDHEEHWYCT